jgi:hypothetical protein
MCNANNLEGLKDCIGLEPVANYIIQNRLFKDKLFEMDPRIFSDFNDIGIKYPITGKMREDLFTNFLVSNQNLEKLLVRANLIKESDKIISFEKKSLENGFSGVI